MAYLSCFTGCTHFARTNSYIKDIDDKCYIIYIFAKTNQKNKISKYLADLSSKLHFCAGTICHVCKIIIETNPELFTANLSAKICTKGTQQVFPTQSSTTLQRYSHQDVLLDIIKSKSVSYWVN